MRLRDMARPAMPRRGKTSSGLATLEWNGLAWVAALGGLRYGMATQARHGPVRSGMLWKARQRRPGVFSHGEAGSGPARLGEARQVWPALAW